MNLNLRFVPIEHWPQPYTKEQQVSRFRSSYVATLILLENELGYLDARNAVIQTGHKETDIRQDGMPKATARAPQFPGVIVSFDSKYGPLSYPCDTYTHWHANLRAIALSLQALRAVDRYGVTRRAEQYQGWKRLSAAPVQANDFRSAEEAAEFILRAGDNPEPKAFAGTLANNPRYLPGLYKSAAAKLHPDAGGSHEGFVRLQAARELLEAHYEGMKRR